MVREAVIDDLFAILGMARDLHAESRLAFMPFSPDRFRRHLEHCMSLGFLEVAIEGHEYVGFMMGLIGPSFYSECMQGVEMILYVKPDERGSRHAKDLLDHFTQWSARTGAVECVAGSGAGVDIERVRKFYERNDYVKVGDLFARRV